MKKIARRRLSLKKEYVRILAAAELAAPRGGAREYPSETWCGDCTHPSGE